MGFHRIDDGRVCSDTAVGSMVADSLFGLGIVRVGSQLDHLRAESVAVAMAGRKD